MLITNPITAATRAVAVTGVVCCDLAGETVLLHLASNTYFGLDETGTQIWNSLRESRTIREIRDELLRSYEVAPEQCEQAVIALISDLAKHGLVTLSLHEATA
ncbi:MAG TPA: PqqD family protein [Bryobacteraceae bacterium]|nr:PqqD family protein [Bryobacteraceae bacterium]